MRAYGTLEPNDYTVEKYETSAEVEWQLTSSSLGMVITYPSNSAELSGSVIINRAKKQKDESVNVDTGTLEYVLYSSIKHLFYDRGTFISSSRIVSNSIAGIPDEFFSISIGKNLYGNKIEPGSFELYIHPNSSSISDDTYGNLIVSESGTSYYVGNIFYEKGIAVIKHNTTAPTSSINNSGLKIISGSTVFLDYKASTTFERHEAVIKLLPTEFNFSSFNPSISNTVTVTGSKATEFTNLNIPSSSQDNWKLYELMSSNIIIPYVTSIGLYNSERQLIAVAKLSKPIQRTFNTEQIFIIRFDVEYE